MRVWTSELPTTPLLANCAPADSPTACKIAANHAARAEM